MKNGAKSTAPAPPPPAIKVTHPWVIVHEVNDGKEMETILGGPESARTADFAVCAADVIRHIAVRFQVPESEVLAAVQAELAEPTTEPIQ